MYRACPVQFHQFQRIVLFARSETTETPQGVQSLCHSLIRNPSGDSGVWPSPAAIGKNLLKACATGGEKLPLPKLPKRHGNPYLWVGARLVVNGQDETFRGKLFWLWIKMTCEGGMTILKRVKTTAALMAGVAAIGLWSGLANAQELPSPFAQVVAAEASVDAGIAAFYREHGYPALWTGEEGAKRREALFNALVRVEDQDLPANRYDLDALKAMLATAQTEGDRAKIEVAYSKVFVKYARDMKSGILDPKSIDKTLVREVVRPKPEDILAALLTNDAAKVLRDQMPKSPQFAQLLRAKIDLQAKIKTGGWGPTVPARALDLGQSGPAVVVLRDRLIAMGYLGRSATQTYDANIASAVQRFQLDHGLKADGAANAATLAEINVSPEKRLRSIHVAIERMRWLGDAPLGERHVWVNLPDFTAKIIDHGKVTFETRAVIGKDTIDTHTPEFSDVMEHMVINPSWGVPRSIIVKEYLPLLQSNPNAVSHLQVVDGRGRVVPRGSVNFAAYSSRSFPYGLRQPPSDGNALGKVKFMFPNPYNIYLHDTPAKALFKQDVRAYSHGCIRLADPIDFALALLAVQDSDPKGTFDRYLKTGQESTVSLEKNIPVHLVYFTAFPGSRGQMTYRHDVYGRDAAIANALAEAGVELGGEQG